jgi:hypothetical protein
MRHPLTVTLLVLGLTAGIPTPAAQVSIGINLPGISIGINQPTYPELVPVPGYPVYYAPGASCNYFFYDGGYWVFQGDNWYVSSWFNGPWRAVAPEYVPSFVLRVPVRYFRVPPPYFRGWAPDGPPRWGDHWGPAWQNRRAGWDHWDRHAAPPAAPLPHYQRDFEGARYPREEQQGQLHHDHYSYQPKEHWQSAPPPGRGGDPRGGRHGKNPWEP